MSDRLCYDIPEGYKPIFALKEIMDAIKLVKDTFKKKIEKELNLKYVTAPIMVDSDNGVNDNLNGYERPVEFEIRETGKTVQIIHSLAKWKRVALKKYGFTPGEGLYTDMNAIRRDEDLDCLHSIFVDQWSWEKVISPEERNFNTVKTVVKKILRALRNTEIELIKAFPEKHLEPSVPNEIYFITAQELEDMYPEKTPKERENLITQKHGAVFLSQIGKALKSGESHDGRSPDYDDWELNGDILLWYEPLQISFELSSMGIRVDQESLLKQLKESNNEDRKNLYFHSMLLNDELPLTIGGGLGQSRICMYLLKTAHIGEVNSSIWPQEMINRYREKGIEFL